jgi:hypothetical protein
MRGSTQPIPSAGEGSPWEHVHNRLRTPMIFLAGPPAGGKTTARRVITRALRAHGLSIADFSIEEAHRLLCPRPDRPGLYHYEPSGALVLERREEQIPEALALMAEKCKQASDGGFVAEFTHPDTAVVLCSYFAGLMTGATVIYITAPGQVRLQRNQRRRKLRIPQAVVEKAPEELSEEDRAELAARGAGVYTIENRSTKTAFTHAIDTFTAELLVSPGENLPTACHNSENGLA